MNNLTELLYKKYGNLTTAYRELPLSAPTIISARNGIFSMRTKSILEKCFKNLKLESGK